MARCSATVACGHCKTAFQCDLGAEDSHKTAAWSTASHRSKELAKEHYYTWPMESKSPYDTYITPKGKL